MAILGTGPVDGRTYGGYAPWQHIPELTRDGGANDPAADSMEAMQEYRERQDAATRARHCEQAQAGYAYCGSTPGDPCGPGRYPHDGHAPGPVRQLGRNGLRPVGR